MCRRTEEEVGPTVGLPCQTFLGFFNVPVQAAIRGQPFLSYSEKPSTSFTTHGHTEDLILILNLRVPTAVLHFFKIDQILKPFTYI